MSVNPSEIVKTIKGFPVSVQEEIVRELQQNLQIGKDPLNRPTEDEIERMLLAKGLISEIPTRSADAEEDIYEPVEVSGESLSATILKERE